MSALKYIRPIPDIGGTVRDIWAKCQDERFDYGLGSCQEIDSDDMDVEYLVNAIQGVTRAKLGSPSMVEVNATNPYEIESSQFVFCIQPYDEGAAVWKDGARCIEVGNHTVLYCETGNLEAIDKRGGHYLCLWEHN